MTHVDTIAAVRDVCFRGMHAFTCRVRGDRPPVEDMIAFIDDHRNAYGLEPICRILPIAPSTYHAHVAQRHAPSKRSVRARRDASLRVEVARVLAENFEFYGARKVWRQMRREGFDGVNHRR